jgi:hypothetical protein
MLDPLPLGLSNYPLAWASHSHRSPSSKPVNVATAFPSSRPLGMVVELLALPYSVETIVFIRAEYHYLFSRSLIRDSGEGLSVIFHEGHYA